MEMLAKTDGGAIMNIGYYEARIALYKEQIGTGYIGIGKTLNEAKEAGVVPHGEWESWVTRTTGLDSRQAQRCMQAAREIRDGSELARLEMSKALALLSSGLEDEEQEAIAKKAADEGSSLKALKAEIQKLREEKEADLADSREVIRKLKLQITQESGAAAEMKDQLRRASVQRDSLIGRLQAAQVAYRQQIDREKEKAYQQGAKDTRKNAETEAREAIRKEYEGKMTFINSKSQEKDEIIKDLQSQVNQVRAEQTRAWDQGFEAAKGEAEQIRREALDKQGAQIDDLKQALKASEEDVDTRNRQLDAANARVKELQEELEAAERREAKRAEELARMKKEKAQSGMDAARGIGGSAMGALDLAAAVRSFIGVAGVLPQMGNILSGMTEKERENIRVQVETIARWVTDSRKAMGIVMADASIQ